MLTHTHLLTLCQILQPIVAPPIKKFAQSWCELCKQLKSCVGVGLDELNVESKAVIIKKKKIKSGKKLWVNF